MTNQISLVNGPDSDGLEKVTLDRDHPFIDSSCSTTSCRCEQDNEQLGQNKDSNGREKATLDRDHPFMDSPRSSSNNRGGPEDEQLGQNKVSVAGLSAALAESKAKLTDAMTRLTEMRVKHASAVKMVEDQAKRLRYMDAMVRERTEARVSTIEANHHVEDLKAKIATMYKQMGDTLAAKEREIVEALDAKDQQMELDLAEKNQEVESLNERLERVHREYARDVSKRCLEVLAEYKKGEGFQWVKDEARAQGAIDLANLASSLLPQLFPYLESFLSSFGSIPLGRVKNRPSAPASTSEDSIIPVDVEHVSQPLVYIPE